LLLALPELRSLKLNFPSADRWIILVLAVLFLGSLFWYYARTLPPLEKKPRRLLLTLRFLGFLFLFLVLAEPILALFLSGKQKPVVAVLVDRSASMALEKEKREVIADQAVERLTVQKGDWEFKKFDFADSLAEYRSLSPAKGTATAIGSVLRYVSEIPDLAGLVVISDGANNSGPDPVGAAKKLDLPVYTVAVGREEQAIDLGIEGISFPSLAFEGTPVKVEFLLSARGVGKIKLPFTVSRGSKKIIAPMVDFAGDGEKTVKVELTPDSVGTLTYRAGLPALAGESQLKNNRRVFSLKVLKARERVLLAAGSPGWNYRFLKQVLEENSRLDVDGLVYGPGAKPLFSAVPLDAQNLEAYDVLIFTDFPPALFSGIDSRLLSLVRDKGKGVFFCLGEQFPSASLSPAFAQLLPLDFKKTRPSLFAPIGDLTLTPEGNSHPATRFVSDPAEQANLWKNLPPLEGVVVSDFPSTNGTILAAVSGPVEPARIPALSAKNLGTGRVLAATVYPLWKWYFLPAGTATEDTTFAWFINQACGWLAGSEEEGRFNLSTDKLVYNSGEEIGFSAAAFDLAHKPTEGLDVRIDLGKEDGENLLLYEEAVGRYAGRKRAIQPGTYTAVAAFLENGKKIGEAIARFTVEELSLEDRSVSFNATLLEKIAAVSGGTFYRLDEIERFARDFNPQKEEWSRKKEWELAHQPFLLVGMILFLAAEWYLRRRWQLL